MRPYAAVQPNLATLVSHDPVSIRQVFEKFDIALNRILPDNNAHSRYLSIGEVGLALVVAQDLPIDAKVEVRQAFYKPDQDETLGRVATIASNHLRHPDAWTPKASDAELLGGKVPKNLGRFTAFALAKIYALSLDPDPNRISSHSEDTKLMMPGAIDIAGGLRLSDRSLIAVSGLWAVHDHAIARLAAVKLRQVSAENVKPEDADALAAELESLFATISLQHQGVRAENLSPQEVTRLLPRVDALVEQLAA